MVTHSGTSTPSTTDNEKVGFKEAVNKNVDHHRRHGRHRHHKKHEDHEVEAHRHYRQHPGHQHDHAAKGGRRPPMANRGNMSFTPEMGAHHHEDADEHCIPGVVMPGATGVVYASDRAAANGFEYGNPEWANLGQGAPEVGPIPGASERPTTIDLTAMGDLVNEYGPTAGIKGLRDAVANYYNETYRKNKTSKYTHENVCIVPGGRAGLIRVAAVIGDVYTAFQIPEYTAYTSMLSCFRRLVPIPMSLRSEDKYTLNIEELKHNIQAMGISVVILSNPRNPTGQIIRGKELEDLVDISRQGTTVILDEFYSWYQYAPELEGKSVSAAEYVDDVNKDPVVLIDGLTKNWRLPGWRCCWVVGPKSLVQALGQSGSFLDGGCSHPTQVAAIPLLDLKRVQQDRLALQKCFKAKRDYVLKRLHDMGLTVAVPPEATFYIWLDLSPLPPPLNIGATFFEELLKEKVIVVIGLGFDINPNSRRNLHDSPCAHFVRISFGPTMEECVRGMDGIQRVVDKAHQLHKRDGHLLNGMGRGYAKSHPGSRSKGTLESSGAGS